MEQEGAEVAKAWEVEAERLWVERAGVVERFRETSGGEGFRKGEPGA